MENFAIYPTFLGNFRIAHDGDTVVLVKKVHDACIHDYGTKSDLTELVYTQLCEFFSGKRTEFTIKYTLKGTEFQKKVWNALCDIPYGTTCSYKDIAKAIDNEKACRAVGLANNKNPISIIVPCHRVIGSNGNLVGYGGGLEMKQFLLHLESKYR